MELGFPMSAIGKKYNNKIKLKNVIYMFAAAWEIVSQKTVKTHGKSCGRKRQKTVKLKIQRVLELTSHL